jgi:hypothetical protein
MQLVTLMRSRNSLLTLSIFVFAVLSMLPSQSRADTALLCKLINSKRYTGTERNLPVRKLSPAEKAEGLIRRACLIAYSDGFPGGEQAFLHATADDIGDDLDHVKALFDIPSAQRTIQGTPWIKAPHKTREFQIALGWDREQVLLWGSFAYIQRLTREGRSAEIVDKTAAIRKALGLQVAPLKTTDELEEHTYFSPQNLRNMIVTMEFAARADLNAGNAKEMKLLAAEYLKVHDDLSPFGQMATDPTVDILTRYCYGLNKRQSTVPTKD